jgi:hypothetical protein
MVMCHEVEDGSHIGDEESDKSMAMETPLDRTKNVRSLMVEL